MEVNVSTTLIFTTYKVEPFSTVDMYIIMIVRMDYSPLRSHHSQRKVMVKFINRHKTLPVSLQWLDYDGERVEYALLGPGEAFEVDTFCTHPWVLDSSNKDLLFVWPGELKTFFEAYHFSQTLAAKVEHMSDWSNRFLQGEEELVIYINGMYQPQSLREATLISVAQAIKFRPDYVQKLRVPHVLEQDLRAVIDMFLSEA